MMVVSTPLSTQASRASRLACKISIKRFRQRSTEAQSFVETKAVVERFRQAGIQSINIDLVYGLPHQTRDSVAQTVDQVLTLSPDRIALFGYAHLPARLAHQRLIEDAALPGPIERLAQSKTAASDIIKHGYVRVGLDHFAKPTDTLATRPVKRNFQGYSSDDAKSLIGFGASAIGQFAQGYVQNAVPVAEYTRRVRERGLATARGVLLSQEDRARALVINRLMCELSFPSKELRSQFGDIADVLIKEADQLLKTDCDGLLEMDEDSFRVSEKGRPFVRSICAHFDSYLADHKAKYSTGI